MISTNNSQRRRFVMLQHDLLNSPAWQSMPAVARALYVEMAKRFDGRNNGRISYSAREAAQELHISPDTASRFLRLLESRGLIRCTRRGTFSGKDAKASEWELTAYPTVRLQGLSSPITGTANGLSSPITGTLIYKDIDSIRKQGDFRRRKYPEERRKDLSVLKRYRHGAQACPLTQNEQQAFARLRAANGSGGTAGSS